MEATLADPPTVTVGGITTPLDGADPQRDLVLAAAAQARGNGRPIRARVTTPGGDVHHLIVTTTGRVVPLHQPGPPAGNPPGKTRPGGRGTRGPARTRHPRHVPEAGHRARPGRGWAGSRGRCAGPGWGWRC